MLNPGTNSFQGNPDHYNEIEIWFRHSADYRLIIVPKPFKALLRASWGHGQLQAKVLTSSMQPNHEFSNATSHRYRLTKLHRSFNGTNQAYQRNLIQLHSSVILGQLKSKAKKLIKTIKLKRSDDLSRFCTKLSVTDIIETLMLTKTTFFSGFI